MLPFLQLFGKQIPLYSLMTLAGIGCAVLYLRLRLKPSGLPEADVELAFLYALLGGGIGAKLLYLATCWETFVSELPYLFRVPQLFLAKYFNGGFVFYGGLFGCLLAVWIYCRCCRLDYFAFIRLMLPAFPLFHAFGRIGCFCAGCCYGVHTDAFFGVVFHHSDFAPNGEPLVPVQLFEAFGEFLLFLCLARAAAKQTDGRKLLGIYLTAYGLLRFVLEFFRGDPYRGFIGALSLSQAISVVCAAAGLLFFFRSRSGAQKQVLLP